MKRQLSIIALTAALIGGGTLSAHAFMGPDGECGGPRAEGKMEHGKRFGRMARELKLSDAQKEQVQAILKAEQEKNAPLREKLAENRKKLHEAAQAEKFDEAAVKALAATQADLQAQLIVSRARAHSQIHALLTPEQRELAKKLRPQMKGGKGGKQHKHRSSE